MKRSMFVLVAMLAAATAFAGQDAPAKKAGGKVYAHFTTNLGKFTVELFEKDAPKTVANFVGLADGTKEWTLKPSSAGYLEGDNTEWDLKRSTADVSYSGKLIGEDLQRNR